MRTKIGTLNAQKKYTQKSAHQICKKKAVAKFADLVRVHKNKWILMQTKCSAHTAWLL